MRKAEFNYQVSKRKEKIVMWVAWHLPRTLAMWAYYRVLAHATTGKYGKTLVTDLTAMDAIDRFCKDNNL